MAQGAIQGANYAVKHIKKMSTARTTRPTGNRSSTGTRAAWPPSPGSTRWRRSASSSSAGSSPGSPGWSCTCYYLVGYRNRLVTIIAWLVTFIGRGRGQMVITEQMVYARLAMENLETMRREQELAEAERLAGELEPGKP